MPRAITKDDSALFVMERNLKAMIQTEGWKDYVKVLAAHQQAKLQEAMEPSGDIATIAMQNAAKGAIKAFTLAVDLPQAIIRQATSVRQELNPQDRSEIDQ